MSTVGGMETLHSARPAQDPRNRGRYLTEAFTVAVVLAILLTSSYSRDLTRSWWLWIIASLGFAWRAWAFWRDLGRFERWQRAHPE